MSWTDPIKLSEEEQALASMSLTDVGDAIVATTIFHLIKSEKAEELDEAHLKDIIFNLIFATKMLENMNLLKFLIERVGEPTKGKSVKGDELLMLFTNMHLTSLRRYEERIESLRKLMQLVEWKEEEKEELQ